MVAGGGNDYRSEISLLLTSASRRLESLPPDMQTAFHAGNLYPSALKRFLELEANWLCKIFMPFQGVLSFPAHAGCRQYCHAVLIAATIAAMPS